MLKMNSADAMKLREPELRRMEDTVLSVLQQSGKTEAHTVEE